MKTNIVLLATVAASVTLAACQFQAGTGPQAPAGTPAAGTTPAAGAIPAPEPHAPSARVMNLLKVRSAIRPNNTVKIKGGGIPTTPTTPTTPPGTEPPPPPATGEPTVITSANPFGTGDANSANFLGSLYDVPTTTDKLPDLNTLKPIGTLFAKEINVANAAFAEGFPQVNKKSDHFAIRYEAPLTVEAEADYDLSIVSDDGAQVFIDDIKIVDNDGVHEATEKTAPVHLVKGTHSIKIDYFQSVNNVALQFYCQKMGAAKAICTGKL